MERIQTLQTAENIIGFIEERSIIYYIKNLDLY